MSKSSSRADAPTVIDKTDLSRAWAKIFLRILDGAGTEIAPLVLSLSGFDQQGRRFRSPGRAPCSRSGP